VKISCENCRFLAQKKAVKIADMAQKQAVVETSMTFHTIWRNFIAINRGAALSSFRPDVPVIKLFTIFFIFKD